MKKVIIILSLAILSLTTWAYDFQVDQLCYNINDENPTEVEVTYQQDPSSGDPAYPSLAGNVTIPSTVTYNGNTYTVTSIGERAFRECSSLTSVTIPEGVTSIEGTAFEGCSSLTSVTIPNSVTNVGLRAFCFCSSLTSVTIGNSVTSIAWTFWGCSSLTSVTIGNSVASIGVYAFRYCSSLTSVNIPNSVTSIGGGAFEGCSSLTSVTIPNSVTSIEGIAFRDCSSLTSVTIGNNVTGIGNTAFGYCSSLIEIIVLATNPPVTDTNAFQEVNRDIPLYVPAASIEAYRTADVWKEFTNILPLEVLTHKQLEIMITGNGTIQYGETTLTRDTTLYIEPETVLTMQILPAQGHRINSLTYNGTDYTPNVTADGTLTLPAMTENGTLSVQLEEIPVYTISYYVEGSDVYFENDVISGDNFTVRVKPHIGKNIYSVTLNGVDITSQLEADGTLTLYNITEDQTLVVSTEDTPSNISSSTPNHLRAWQANGTIFAEVDDNVATLQLYDVSGRLMNEHLHNGNYQVITLPAPNEVNILKVVGKDGSITAHKLM